MKNPFDKFISRCDTAEESISKSEDCSIKITQIETLIEKKGCVVDGGGQEVR